MALTPKKRYLNFCTTITTEMTFIISIFENEYENELESKHFSGKN